MKPYYSDADPPTQGAAVSVESYVVGVGVPLTAASVGPQSRDASCAGDRPGTRSRLRLVSVHQGWVDGPNEPSHFQAVTGGFPGRGTNGERPTALGVATGGRRQEVLGLVAA